MNRSHGWMPVFLAVVLAASGFTRSFSVEVPCEMALGNSRPQHVDLSFHSGGHDSHESPSKQAAKCCSLCVSHAAHIFNRLLDRLNLDYSPVLYPALRHGHYGHWAFVDPDIPKDLS